MKTPNITIKTTTRDGAMQRRNGLPPIHPGEIIREDILPLGWLVSDWGCQGFGSVAADAARHFGGAQTALGCDVPEGCPAVWRLSGGMGTPAGRLRFKKIRAKQESDAAHCADRSA
jgi:hypothetical protein